MPAETESPVKRQLRTLQTYAPWIRTAKFGFYNFTTRQFGLNIQPELHLLKHLPEPGLVLDIGANWGQTICAVRRFCPNARIVSFEPNGLLAEYLQRRFARDDRVEIHQLALADMAGESTLHVPVYRGFVFDGLASIHREQASGWLNADRIANFDPGKLSLQCFTVPRERLDAFGLRPDFIKIDVQGAELDVLKGGAETLASQPVVLLECANLEITRFLASFELFPYGFSKGRLVMLSPSANTVFMARRHVEQSGLDVVRAA